MTDTPENPREGDRIAKLLARAGVASRREVERMIEEGRIKLNDEPVTTPATILTTLRGVTVDGKPVRMPEPARIFAFHKPSGLITAERDPAGRPTIYTALRNALPKDAPRVMPIGRLDLNTEGLLLLTNDGELKRALELPSTGIPRTYRARTFGDITQARLEELSEGVEIEGIRYGSINANMERRTGRNQWIELTLTEGKNREVRRVLEHLGLQVSRLLRIGYGPFALDDLPRGAAVELAERDVEQLRKSLNVAAPAEATARRKTLATEAPHKAKAEPRNTRPAPRGRGAELRNPGPAKPRSAEAGHRSEFGKPGFGKSNRGRTDAARFPGKPGEEKPYRATGGRGEFERREGVEGRPERERSDRTRTERANTERANTERGRPLTERSERGRPAEGRPDGARPAEGGRTQRGRPESGRPERGQHDSGRGGRGAPGRGPNDRGPSGGGGGRHAPGGRRKPGPRA